MFHIANRCYQYRLLRMFSMFFSYQHIKALLFSRKLKTILFCFDFDQKVLMKMKYILIISIYKYIYIYKYIFIIVKYLYIIHTNKILVTIKQGALWSYIEAHLSSVTPASIYVAKVNNRNTRTICEICSKLNNKDTNQWRRSGAIIVYFIFISSHIILVFLLLTLNN